MIFIRNSTVNKVPNNDLFNKTIAIMITNKNTKDKNHRTVNTLFNLSYIDDLRSERSRQQMFSLRW